MEIGLFKLKCDIQGVLFRLLQGDIKPAEANVDILDLIDSFYKDYVCS